MSPAIRIFSPPAILKPMERTKGRKPVFWSASPEPGGRQGPAGEHCSKCLGGKIWRASTTWKHFKRLLLGIQLRYCRSCGHRWRPGSSHELEFRDPGAPLPLTLSWALAAIAAGLLFIGGFFLFAR